MGLKLSKKDQNELNYVKFNKRCVGPSSTQVKEIELIRKEKFYR